MLWFERSFLDVNKRAKWSTLSIAEKERDAVVKLKF